MLYLERWVLCNSDKATPTPALASCVPKCAPRECSNPSLTVPLALLPRSFDVRKGPIFSKWFEGGETNICYNALDRHVQQVGRWTVFPVVLCFRIFRIKKTELL